MSAQDFIVETNLVLRDTVIILSGNLLVKNGGNLELDGVALKMNCQADGQFKIAVEPGGEMSILNNSTIEALNPEFHYAFSVRGLSFTMKNSTLRGVGWGNKGSDMVASSLTVDWGDQ